MTDDDPTIVDRRRVLRRVGAGSFSPVILTRAAEAATDSSPTVRFTSVGIVHDVDRTITEGDPLVHTCIQSYPMVEGSRILTRTATEEMRTDLVNNERVVHHRDTPPLPVDHLGGTETPIVPIDLTDDLRPSLGFRLDEEVQLPRVVVTEAGPTTKITLPGAGTTHVSPGERTAVELPPIDAAFSRRGETRRRTVRLTPRVVAINHGEMSVSR